MLVAVEARFGHHRIEQAPMGVAAGGVLTREAGIVVGKRALRGFVDDAAHVELAAVRILEGEVDGGAGAVRRRHRRIVVRHAPEGEDGGSELIVECGRVPCKRGRTVEPGQRGADLVGLQAELPPDHVGLHGQRPVGVEQAQAPAGSSRGESPCRVDQCQAYRPAQLPGRDAAVGGAERLVGVRLAEGKG